MFLYHDLTYKFDNKKKDPSVAFSYTKIREMTYGENPEKFTVLSYGYLEGRWFVIANSRGRCPVAYVEAKIGDPNLYGNGDEDDDSFEIGYIKKTSIPEVNYGPKQILQFTDDLENISVGIMSKKYWGWSHNVGDDYVVLTTPIGLDVSGEKKYSEKEILQKDVIPFIHWINGINKKNY